ncbi:uncharacterized protein LOC100906274 [Galendromus occidentalis]|uniref:Uncharacterized protein LOC100906274 n=1 Tax=Galendromus occidentalis TaxID=34638 RepID=A0AAJ7WIG8_9ACAR|nr:uncharacterized protein LOC100906274 [Galendromus occidentalis]
MTKLQMSMRVLRRAPSLRQSSSLSVRCPVAETATSQHSPRDEANEPVRPFEEIPGPQPLPIVGNIWRYILPFGGFDITKMHLNAAKLKREFGNLVREKVVADRTLVHVFDPRDIETVFRNEGRYPTRLSHRALLKYREQRPNTYRNGGVIPTNGAEWAELRQKFQMPMLRKESLELYRDGLFDVADDVLDICHEFGSKAEKDFVPTLYVWALEATGLLALNTRLGCVKAPEDPSSRQRRLIEAAAETNRVIMLTENGLPFWRYWDTPTYKKLVRAQDTMTVIVNQYLAESEPEADSDESATVLQQFLSMPGDKRDVYTMITDIFMAGIDTTAYAMTFLLYHLAVNPECQNRLREELRALFDRVEKPTLRDLDACSYLRACTRESHRLLPVALGTGRILENDITLSGYNVPAGTMIVLHNQTTSRDPEHFVDPSEFRPERWLRVGGSEECRGNHPFAYLPFGYGPRMCIGRRFADNTINVLISKMILEFSIEYRHHTPMDCFTKLINVPDQPLKLAFLKNKDLSARVPTLAHTEIAMLRPRSPFLAGPLVRLSATSSNSPPIADSRRVNDSPEEHLSQGLAMIARGMSEVSQALLKYGLPASSTSPASSSPRTVLSRIDEISPKDSFGLNNLCVVIEGLRQLLEMTIEYNLRQAVGTASRKEPIKSNEILVKAVNDTKRFETISIKDPGLGAASKAKKVPATRFRRALTYGGLFAGLGVGTASEVVRRLTSNDEAKKPFLLSQANANRIVETLCQVRGAALKIGQILSIQDSKLVPEEISQLFIRVRDAAHYMPKWQLNQVLTRELGENWRERFDSFDEMPFAAASIGQVHHASFEGRDVAIKVQYPGVAQGINSDIDNLMMVLKVWDILPRGFFINNLVEVARRELAWEVDYQREAAASKRFKELLQHEEVFMIPEVVESITTKRVFASEYVKGVLPVDRLENASQGLRNYVAKNLLRLTLEEIFVYRFMQTDPNWSNFLYQPETEKIILLDFGASRGYDVAFIDLYMKIIDAATRGDVDTIVRHSKEIGFLTGEEEELMIKAHCDAVLILAEAFTVDEFDFGRRETEEKVSQLVPIMLKHRLSPPPEEIYSIHRKLSGIFLLCAKLKAKFDCRQLYFDILANLKHRREAVEPILSREL